MIKKVVWAVVFCLTAGLSTAYAEEIDKNTAQMQAMDKITGRVSKMVKEALDKPLDEMVRNILNDNPTLKQKDLAEMFNLAPSSISKLKKKEA